MTLTEMKQRIKAIKREGYRFLKQHASFGWHGNLCFCHAYYYPDKDLNIKSPMSKHKCELIQGRAYTRSESLISLLETNTREL